MISTMEAVSAYGFEIVWLLFQITSNQNQWSKPRNTVLREKGTSCLLCHQQYTSGLQVAILSLPAIKLGGTTHNVKIHQILPVSFLIKPTPGICKCFTRLQSSKIVASGSLFNSMVTLMEGASWRKPESKNSWSFSLFPFPWSNYAKI